MNAPGLTTDDLTIDLILALVAIALVVSVLTWIAIVPLKNMRRSRRIP